MTDARDWIANHAYRTPDALAQIDIASGRRFTYAEMNERVSHIAGYFDSVAKLDKGEVVGVLSNNSSDTFDIDFACARSGNIFLPMNTRLQAPELAFQLDDSSVKVLFVGAGFEELAEAAVSQSSQNPAMIAIAGSSIEPQLSDIIADSPAYSGGHKISEGDGWSLIYSSGTTGRPKGVLHSYGGVTAQAIGNSVPLGLNPNSVGLTVLPLFHISGLNIFGHAMFYAGATQITLPGFDPNQMLELLADKELSVTHFCAVPTIFEMMAQMPGFADADLSTVEGAFVGGAPSTLGLLETYAEKGMPLIQGYGLTETGPTLTVLDAADATAKIGSAGKTIMHVDIKIVGDNGEELPAGEVGEIIACGPSVIKEYYRRPEAQSSNFYGDWLRTGDMGRFDEDGFLFIMDRKKDMYISGGENVYPAEVESALSKLEGVLQVAIIGVPDEKWGEVGAAYIVKHPDAALTAEDVQAFCDGKMARYKIPKKVHFMEALPLGGSGKVLKTELRKLVE